LLAASKGYVTAKLPVVAEAIAGEEAFRSPRNPAVSTNRRGFACEMRYSH
jgi:hypothetical protein